MECRDSTLYELFLISNYVIIYYSLTEMVSEGVIILNWKRHTLYLSLTRIAEVLKHFSRRPLYWFRLTPCCYTDRLHLPKACHPQIHNSKNENRNIFFGPGWNLKNARWEKCKYLTRCFTQVDLDNGYRMNRMTKVCITNFYISHVPISQRHISPCEDAKEVRCNPFLMR